MSPTIIAIVAALLCTQAPAPSTTAGLKAVTLAEAMQLAAKNNTDYQAALAQVEIAKAQQFRGYGVVMPDLSLGGQYVRTTAPAQLDFGGIIQLVGGVYQLAPANPQLIPGPVDIVAVNSLYGTAQATQVLFAPQFFLLSALKPGTQAALLGAMEAREQVLLGVARVYLGLQGLQQIEKAAQDAEAVALKHEKDVSAQVSLGTNVEVALFRAKTDTAQARTTIAQLQGTKAGLLAMLASLTGEAIEPIADGPSLDFAAEPPSAQAEPWANTYLVRTDEQLNKVYDSLVFGDRLLWLPTLAAFFKGSYNSNSGFTGKNWMADFGVSLTFPLFDRGQRYAQLWEDEGKLHMQQAKLRGDRLKAEATWQTAKANLTAAEAALAQAQSQAELAAKAQKMTDGAFQVGLATALELSDIDNKAFFAKSQAAQSKAALEVRKVEMVAAEGRLAKMLGLSELK